MLCVEDRVLGGLALLCVELEDAKRRSWKTSPAGRLRGDKQTGKDGETDSRQPHRQQVQCIVYQRALGRMVRLRRMKEGEESKVVE